MDNIDLAKQLLKTSETKPTQTTTITGVATSDSSDGYVMVDTLGTSTTQDDAQAVKMPTTVSVLKGDTVRISLVGQDGTAKTPTVTGVVGGGDRTNGLIQKIKNFFWHDDDGAHVSTVENDATTGPNVLITANGFSVRDGTKTLTNIDGDSFDIYKSDGNLMATVQAGQITGAGGTYSGTASAFKLIGSGNTAGATVGMDMSADATSGDDVAYIGSSIASKSGSKSARVGTELIYTGLAQSTPILGDSRILMSSDLLCVSDGTNTENFKMSDVISALGIMDMFRFREYSASITVSGNGHGAVNMGAINIPDGYTFIGLIPKLIGCGDQWNVTLGLYGNSVYGYVKSNYGGELTSVLSCVAVYVKTTRYITV